MPLHTIYSHSEIDGWGQAPLSYNRTKIKFSLYQTLENKQGSLVRGICFSLFARKRVFLFLWQEGEPLVNSHNIFIFVNLGDWCVKSSSFFYTRLRDRLSLCQTNWKCKALWAEGFAFLVWRNKNCFLIYFGQEVRSSPDKSFNTLRNFW